MLIHQYTFAFRRSIDEDAVNDAQYYANSKRSKGRFLQSLTPMKNRYEIARTNLRLVLSQDQVRVTQVTK